MQTYRLGMCNTMAACSSHVSSHRKLFAMPLVRAARLVSLHSSDRVSRDIATNFRRSTSWAPSFETIDEIDRRKRFQITMRFEDADKDKNGRIDMEELRSVLESSCCDTVEGHLLQHWLSGTEVSRLMRRYDTDNSGDLDADEFQKLVNDGLLLDEKLSDYQAAFTAVDTDHSGDVSAAELGQVLSRLGWSEQKCSEGRVQELMNRYGVNDRGHLDLNAFMSLMKDEMLDVREVLAYLGARPESPTTTRAVIHAVSNEHFSLIMSDTDLEDALLRAGDKLTLLMAGTTWCTGSRAIVADVKALAAAYPAVKVLLLWGNVNDSTKWLFRDQLMVRSTPAFFLFRDGVLLCHWAGGDAAKLESELRKRIDFSPDVPAVPIFQELAA